MSTDHWRVAHAFNSTLPGWLVAVPKRHVTAIHELSPEEAEPLGALLRDLSCALQAVTACEKTYVIQFAEQAGFAHVHFHVVPRMTDFAEHQYGPEVFWFLKQPQDQWLPTDEMDRIALAVRAELGK